ncbi:MAG TPA: methyltransferase domain-containing protein [Waterburya sp.]|jgi:2-polyprenyl-3-methyl-5-hydroxy-6-metoxy-1,4-benzoquinol methylase
MQTLASQYQYAYLDGESSHHHAYLLPPLLEMLSAIKRSRQQKLRVLDLGCGNGSLSHRIAQQGYEVVGVEDSEQGVAIARQTFPNCHFIHASVYELPFADLENSFDIVLSAEVIEHLLYPRELVRAAKKCLKPNGHLIVTTPYHGYLKNLAIALLGKMDQHFDPLWDGGHIKFFSVSTLRELLETENYTEIQFKFSGRVPFLWKSMLCSCSIV